MTPLVFIDKVRRRMNNPLLQSPTPKQILERGIDEYRNATMMANNTGNAWAVKEYTLTTIADTRRYEITALDFSKALLVATVPSEDGEPEMPLEVTQMEQLPRDWAWLSDIGNWTLWSWNVSQRARYVATYRLLAPLGAGFKNYLEIRPTPSAGEEYRVLYQVGDWSPSVLSDLAFRFPFPELDFYFVALVAQSLLSTAQWSGSSDMNDYEMKKLSIGLEKDLERYQKTWDNFIASLTVADAVYAEPFGESQGIWS